MSNATVEQAKLRLEQALFWKNNGAALGDWTSWGDVRRNEEYLQAEINLIKVTAQAENRPLRQDEIAKIQQNMDQIAQNRVRQIEMTVAQPGTREYHVMREKEYQLQQKLAFEEEVKNMRNNNGQNNDLNEVLEKLNISKEGSLQ